MTFIKAFLNENPKVRFTLKNILGEGLVENYHKTSFDKNCLLMYIVKPFKYDEIGKEHQNYWQVKQIAKILSQYGYNVDVIDYDNSYIKFKKKYDLVIDLIPGKNNVFKNHMNEGCKTIAYLTGSNATFQNSAELKRIDDLKLRKSVEIEPRRQSPYLTKDIEKYTACFMIGNSYNWKTYTNEFKLKEPYYIKNTGHKQEYYFDGSKKNKKAFLYFGSSGCVHKGLDLLLDIFSKENFPCELYVCGSFKDEKDFEQAYNKELYETKNIHPIGFVSIESDLFRELTEKCVYSIMPSCSEGLAGSVLTTMSAGLINICSIECGLEADEVIHLADCSIDTIEKTVLEYAEKDDNWIKLKSRESYDIIQKKYSEKHFIESLTVAIDGVLK